MKITESKLRRLIRNRILLEKSGAKEDQGSGAGQPATLAGVSGGLQGDSSRSYGSSTFPTGGGGGRVPEGDISTVDGAVILKMEPLSSSPNVVYIIRGQGYGNQRYIRRKIQSDIGSEPNTIVAISTSPHTSFSSLSSVVQDYIEALPELPDGSTPGRERVVGWSLGASGLKNVLSDPGPSRFDRVWYADPSPRYLIGSDHGKSRMLYRIDNWDSWAHQPMQDLAAEVNASGISIREALSP
jgi:hypothetical protein